MLSQSGNSSLSYGDRSIMLKFVGLILLLVGIYFLGQNILFTTSYSFFSYGRLPAFGSVLSIIIGTTCLVCFRRQTGNAGWIFLGIGIVLVFLSGGVILRPTSLWNFFVGFAALIGGYQLLTTGRFRF